MNSNWSTVWNQFRKFLRCRKRAHATAVITHHTNIEHANFQFSFLTEQLVLCWYISLELKRTSKPPFYIPESVITVCLIIIFHYANQFHIGYCVGRSFSMHRRTKRRVEDDSNGDSMIWMSMTDQIIYHAQIVIVSYSEQYSALLTCIRTAAMATLKRDPNKHVDTWAQYESHLFTFTFIASNT